MSATTRVLLVGAAGRMGKAVSAAAADRNSGLTIAGGIERGGALEPALENCDVVIDFSLADATEEVCRACAAKGKPLVLGTTGHTTVQKAAITAAAQQIPLVYAANFSIGVNALFALTRRAAALLGKEFDVEVVEMHHRKKKDAPSGTAKRLLEVLLSERGADEIPAHSVRAGDIVGEHTVLFAGPGERLELTHRAASRETFAVGALRAARWVIGRPAALYSMEDVLGL
ncbi:MAG: 4-hydroxy-tetrahydrodipicolinate reductase [Chthoniobacterales bacterium]